MTRLPAPDTTPPTTTRYEIRNPAGELVATHCRTDPGKRIWWEPKGVKANAMPLYRIEHARGSTGPVVITEGEKAADALAGAVERDLLVVGTVTGAGGTPHADVLAPIVAHSRVNDVPIYLWPDADDPGSTHMQRVVAAVVEAGGPTPCMINWEGAPPKGDAADWVAAGQPPLVKLLEGAKPFDDEQPVAAPTRPTKNGLDAYECAARICQDIADRAMWVSGRGWFVRSEPTAIWGHDEGDCISRRWIQNHVVYSDQARRGTSERQTLTSLEPMLAAAGAELDADDWTCGLPDGAGVLDLHNGDVRPATGDDRITMTLGCVPEDGNPRLWFRVIQDTFTECDDHAAVVEYLRWWLRRALSGDCSAEAMLFLFGPPGCGKSTVADTLLHIAGSYGATLSAEHVVGDSNQHRAWLARLDRKRLVRINEMPSKGAWRTSDLLSLVSGEMITANHMRRDPFDFRSRVAVCATGNHAPFAPSGSGYWRRLRQIDCRHTPDQPDPTIRDQLRRESGCILAWILAGPADEPAVPPEMTMAVESQRADVDSAGEWIEQHYQSNRNGQTSNQDAWELYMQSTMENDRVSKRAFYGHMGDTFGPSRPVRLNGKLVRVRRCSRR